MVLLVWKEGGVVRATERWTLGLHIRGAGKVELSEILFSTLMIGVEGRRA